MPATIILVLSIVTACAAGWWLGTMDLKHNWSLPQALGVWLLLTLAISAATLLGLVLCL